MISIDSTNEGILCRSYKVKFPYESYNLEEW